MSNMTQPCCDPCWVKHHHATAAPARMRPQHTRVESCGHCGRTTMSGIYVRLHPSGVRWMVSSTRWLALFVVATYLAAFAGWPIIDGGTPLSLSLQWGIGLLGQCALIGLLVTHRVRYPRA